MPVSRDSDPSTLFEAGARAASRVALARLLSMVERGGTAPGRWPAWPTSPPVRPTRMGITGAPGAGKSTLTDRLIAVARGTRPRRRCGPGGQVGVLAIDPSSPFSGGAILGDRVRMQSHALDDGVFIRSMATRGHLGGLSVAVPDAVRVLSAVGMPVVMVETVGVGQQEVEVAAATDTTVVVVNPGWGDAIQANKAGLLEIADLFVINKADRPGARETRRDLEAMLELTELGEASGARRSWRRWPRPATGVDDLWAAIGRHRQPPDRQRPAGRRPAPAAAGVSSTRSWWPGSRQQIEEALAADQFADITEAMVAGDLDPYEAVDRVLACHRAGPAPTGYRRLTCTSGAGVLR